MGFKMRSGNKTSFKEMGSSEGSPLEIGKWTGMFAQNQKFIGDEIQARRKAKGDGKKDDDEKDETTTTTTTTKDKKPDPKPKDDKPKDDTPKDDTPKDDTPKNEPVADNRAQRASQGWGVEGSDKAGTPDQNVTYDAQGNPKIPTYAEAFSKFKKDSDGKYINPRNDNRYSTIEEFIADAEGDWAEQAKIAKNENLKKQNQPYSKDEEGTVRWSKDYDRN